MWFDLGCVVVVVASLGVSEVEVYVYVGCEVIISWAWI